MEIYLVGGAVRDQLLGYPVFDRDWLVVGATPEQMLDKGFTPVGSDFPVFLHPSSHEEYALARTERKSGKGYKGFNYHASPDVTIEQDLIRRDLTINAMAQADNGDIIDPYHGQQDLARKTLRHVSDAFTEDPLRVLRVARFAARYHHLGFSVAEETMQLMRQLSYSDELHHLTTERVWKEFERALLEQTPLVFLNVLQECAALPILFPEFILFDRLDIDQLATQLQAVNSAEQRLAILLARLTEQDSNEASTARIKHCSQQLKVPNRFRDHALLCRIWCKPLQYFSQIPGEQKLTLIKALNLLKKPEALHPILESSHALFGTDLESTQQQVSALLSKLAEVKPAELIKEGFSGPELGKELHKRQQQLCDQFSHK